MGSIQMLRAGTREMLPRARSEIHPPEHSHFSFVNKFSCSTSLGWFWLVSWFLLANSPYKFNAYKKPYSNIAMALQSMCAWTLFWWKAEKFKMPKYN